MLRPHSNAGGRHSRRGLLLTLQGGLATVAQAQERSGIAPLRRRGLPSLPVLKTQPSLLPGGPMFPLSPTLSLRNASGCHRRYASWCDRSGESLLRCRNYANFLGGCGMSADD
jgi:hypothetical protein